MTNKRTRRTEPPAAADAAAASGDQTRAAAAFPIAGIGASAGGLEAFTELLAHLPLDTGMAFVLVQHLDPAHQSALTQLLARATSLPVREAVNDLQVEPNHVYVIAPDTNLGIEGGALKLRPRAAGRTPNRSIDVFFEALAEDQRERAIGVILSGTASDGTLGLEAIKGEGGITFAQDDSAKYDSMPRSAVAAGCVDFVLAPAAIAGELARIAKHPYVAGSALESAASAGSPEDDHASAVAHEDDDTPLPAGGHGTPDNAALRARAEAEGGRGGDGYKKVLLLLRNHSGVDFSLYKSTTIQRRITRRVVLCKLDTLEQYARFLRGNAKELDALYSDVLISVTSFFRNPDAFETLQREVLPKLLARRGDEPVRVWVLGCSTGQEAYSIAMAFVEIAEQAPRARKLQVFATDLNDSLLIKARHGLYAKNLAGDISPERLRRFFVEEAGGWRVSKPLREMVVFARQNLISDPPFSRMDLITCRNLLIYLEPGLQKKVFPVFHYALKPYGYLWLGASESIGGFTELFEPLDRKHKMYSRKAASTPTLALPGGKRDEPPAPGRRHAAAATLQMGPGQAQAGEGFRAELNAQREADRIVINQFAPPSVLINDELQILQFRGATSAYLEPPTGKASFDLLKMARSGLMLPLRAAINKARKDNQTARKENLRFERDGIERLANVEVIALKNLRERCFLVLFEDADKAAAPGKGAGRPLARARRSPSAGDATRIAELEADLAETREYMQSIQEQYESANEELQAASEEVQSSNEELQSLNEELTTSKEELESSNEELTTLNEEMGNRNAELNRVSNDLVNVQTSAKLVIVLLGRDLTIRRFSAQAEQQFQLLASDLGRPIGNVRHRLELPDLEALVTEVIDSVRAQEREVQDRDGRWFSLRVRPYLTLDNKVDGAVLVLVDIDTLKRSEQAVIESEARWHAMFDATSVGVSETDCETGRLLRVNDRFARIAGCGASELAGKSLLELTHPDDRAAHRAADSRLLRGQTASYEIEQRLVRRDGSSVWVHVTVNLVADAAGRPLRSVAIMLDITERREAQELQSHLAAIVASSDDAIISKDLDGVITSWNNAAQQLFGYAAQEAVGQPVTLLIPADRADEEPEILRRIRRGETVDHYRTVRRRKDGGLLDISLTVSPMRDASGQVIGAATIARDITSSQQAERALRQSHARFEALFDASPIGMYLVDAQLRIRLVSRSARPVFGDIGELIGRDFVEVIHILWPKAYADELVQRFRHTLETDEPYAAPERIEQRLDRGVIEYYEWQINRIPLAEGDYGVVCYFQDISARVQAHNQLEQYAADLREADRRKSEFLAMLAHELRNPLAPISNALAILRRSAAAPAGQRSGLHDGAEQAAVQIMERQVGQMARLVDDLVDVSRISSGKIELRRSEVDLASVVEQVAQSVRPVCDSLGHELTLSLPREPVLLDADPIRLTQIVGNLVNNACKFTDRGGRIAIAVETEAAAVSPQVIIRVSDTGIGIAADQLENIFGMFAQVDSARGRSAGGLGIGLALVKDLVALHGGTVAAHSAGNGQGSEFVVRLPMAAQGLEAPSAIAAPQAAEPVAATARRILVVDDNRDAAESLAALLQLSGHQTRLAHDGLEAVEAAAAFQPDVILLDIGLPKLDGYQAARRIRAQNATGRPVIVALTGWGDEEDRRRSAQAGFDAHLVKPVQADALMKLLG